MDLNSIEAEAAELMETNPAPAERFYGNRIVHELGSWLRDDLRDGVHAGDVGFSLD